VSATDVIDPTDLAKAPSTDSERRRSARTFLEVQDINAEDFGDFVALEDPDAGALASVTWAQLKDLSEALALALGELGVERGDAVGMHMVNRAEHAITDAAALRAGATPVSFYYTLTEEQLTYVAKDCRTKVAFVDEALMPLWRTLRDKLDLAAIVIVGAVGEVDGAITFEALLARGKELLAEGRGRLDVVAGSLTGDDTATIIYTSGTTGPPKGAILTHGGLLFNVRTCLDILGESADNLQRAKQLGLLKEGGGYHQPAGARGISYLPLAHIAERIFSFYTAQYAVGRTRFVRDLTTMAEVLPQVRPLSFLAVPRVWEKFHSAITTKLQAESGLKKVLGLRAVEVARQRGVALLEQRQPGLLLSLQHGLFERIVYSKLREAVGLDQTVIGLTGAAPISKDLLATWIGFGVMISEAFGMTETHAIIAYTPPGEPRAGTVGKPIPGVEIKVADDGELLVKGPNVFGGYLNRDEATAEALVDGWLHTGDLVSLTDEGYLKVIGRKKELIITAGGKNLSPNNIEEAIKTKSPIVGQMLVYGDDKPFVSALVVLDPEAYPVWAGQHGVPTDVAAGAKDPKVLAEVERAVREGNSELAKVEQVKKWTVLGNEWTPDSGELTPTMKLKRPVIHDKYRSEIEAMYAD
jgi:long-chain acyl-CoA synthetase